MAVELAGYKSVLANSLYTKERGDAFEVMLFRRYRYPSEEQVARYVIAKAQRLLKNKNIKREETLDAVSELLENMPETILTQIAGREEDAINGIKAYTPTIYSKTINPTLRCLNVKIGLMDANLLSKKPDPKNPLEWYEKEVTASYCESGHKLGWRWRIELMFNNYSLIERKVLNFLLSEGVSICRRFRMEGAIRSKDLSEVLDTIYNNFNTAKNIRQLADTSRCELESQALGALEKIKQDYENLLEAQLDKEDRIRQVLQSRFIGDLKEQEKRRWLFGEN